MHSPTRRFPVRRAVARGSVAFLLGGGAALSSSTHADSFPSRIDAAELDGVVGFVIRGVTARDEACKSVAPAGDVNADGIADLVVGAPTALRNGRMAVGESYVLFGNGAGFPPLVELATLDETNGFTLRGGYRDDFSGMSVAGVGDVNVDGVDDLVIGAGIGSPNAIPEAGRAYVVFGSAGTFPGVLPLRELDGTAGFLVFGLAPQDRMGGAVSRAGDVNHDGLPDFLLGALGASPGGRPRAGTTYVVFGTPALAAVDLSALDGSDGFIVAGVLEQDFSGASVGAAGDVNGDGVDDYIVGAPRATRSGERNRGACYVVFGSAEAPARQLDLFALDGRNGFVVPGAGGQLGLSVSAAGDLNGDGVADIVAGAPLATLQGLTAAGEAIVVFGSTDGFDTVVARTSLDGERGFQIVGASAGVQLGTSVACAGDINGDGLDDVAVGAPFASPQGRNAAGACYVIFGSRDGFPVTLDPTTLDGTNGFVVEGAAAGDRAGWSVAAAGDLDDDGIDDLIIGAPSASPGGEQRVGEGYVIFGRPAQVPVIVDDLHAVVNGKGVRLSWNVDPRNHAVVTLQRSMQALGPFRTLARYAPAGAGGFEYLDREVEWGETYYYRIVVAQSGGTESVAATLGITVPVAVSRTRLHAPRVEEDGSVTIAFTLDGPERVGIRIFDVRGREVHAFRERRRDAGEHFLSWGGPGRAAGSGVYFVVLRAGAHVDARKLLLLVD